MEERPLTILVLERWIGSSSIGARVSSSSDDLVSSPEPTVVSWAGLSGFLAPLAAEFNNQLVRQLAIIDAEIIPLNVQLLVDEIVASPAIYGLGPTQSLLGSCFDASGERRPACRWAPCRAHPRG